MPLVRSNLEIEKAVNDTTLSEAVAACVFNNIGIDKRVFDSAESIYYISIADKKILDCTFSGDLFDLVQKLISEHATFVNYNRPTDLMHVYTYALIKEDAANFDWYNVEYIQIQIETEYPIEAGGRVPSNGDALIPTPDECLDLVDFLENQIFDIENFGSFSADDRFLWFIAQNKHCKRFKLKNPQHIMAELLSRKLRFSLNEGWEVVAEKDHAGDFLHLTRGKDDYILISCVSKNVTMSGDKSNDLIKCITSLGYTFDETTTRIDQKHPYATLEDVECVYNCLYITWLYDKHSEDIKAIDEYRKTGNIKGIIKESTYCYRLWNGRGPTQLIQNPVSLNIIFMRELIADGYLVESIEYDYVNLRKDNITVVINTTTNESVSITSPQIPLNHEHQVAANLGVKINYIVMPKNETIIAPEPEFSQDVETARMNLIKFLNSYYKIYNTKESTPTTFLELKKLLNDLYAAYTGIKYMDFQLKNPSRFFSAAKVEKLLKDCKIPFTIKSITSNDGRTTIITPIDVDGNPVVKANPTEQYESNAAPAEDESTDTGEYNSIL